MEAITDKELDEIIANCTLCDMDVKREYVVLMAVELRDLRRRWKTFVFCFPWLEKAIVRMSRRR